jgi:hypothetical protein
VYTGPDPGKTLLPFFGQQVNCYISIQTSVSDPH